MANLTLAIPDELYVRMKKMSDIRWSEVARKAIEKRVNMDLSDEERESVNWALRLQNRSRKGRLADLKKKNLI